MLKIKKNSLMVDPQFGRDTRNGRTVVNASAHLQDGDGNDVGRIQMEITTFPPFKHERQTYHETIRDMLNIPEGE